MNNPELRKRNVVVVLGVIGVAVLCYGGYLLNQKGVILPRSEPTPASAPAFAPVFTPATEQTFLPIVEALMTSTLVAPAGIYAGNTPPRSLGESCIYSSPGINRVATPIPDGGHSKFQKYPCVDGYWYMGRKDWVDGAGNWGQDGSLEDGYIKYNQDGSVADRKFFNTQGVRIPGPTK